MKHKNRVWPLLLLLILVPTILHATPPDRIHYQGVLRDAAGQPESGTFDMIFRFFDAESGGNEILADSHTSVGLISNPVTVTDGLFAIDIGGGSVVDGSGPGTFTSVADVVVAHGGNLWLELEIASEVLSPRIQVIPGAHALHAGTAEVAGSIAFQGTLLMDADGPDGDQTISFYENGDPLGESIQWSDGSGRFEVSDTLQADELRSRGSIRVNADGPDGDSFLYFFESLSATSESLAWKDNEHWFEFSDDLHLGGRLSSNDTRLFLNKDGPESPVNIYFYEDGLDTGERITWNDTDDRFEITDTLSVDGNIQVGDISTPVGYNRMSANATAVPDSGDITGPQDLYVHGDIEVDSQLYLGGTLNMGDSNGDQSIFFFNNGLATDQSLTWDDLGDSFSLSSGITVSGDVLASNLTAFGLTRTDDLEVLGTKNFIQDHPYRKDLEIAFVSLEGDEASTFTRGHARLTEGEARIPLSEPFQMVTNPDLGLSAHLTPRGRSADLYIQSIGTDELVVRSDDPEASDLSLDYIVFGLRIGYEDVPIIRSDRFGPAGVPQGGEFDAEYVRDPSLREQSALARYTRMARQAQDRESIDFSGSDALRRAIGPLPNREAGSSWNRPGPPTTPPVPNTSDATFDEFRPLSPAEETPTRVLSDRPENSDREGSTHGVRAEMFRPSRGAITVDMPTDESLEGGDVVLIDPERPELIRTAQEGESPMLIGVVVEEAALALNISEEIATAESNRKMVSVAVSGIVHCKVDAGYGSILPGDLLVSSPTPGHAMRASDPLPGTLLGKALEAQTDGQGTIRVLVLAH